MSFNYREITKKDGTKVVFCNFEELLMDFYGVSSMDEVEPHANSQGEYVIHCPFCKEEGHTKHKLYIKSDLSVGHCFVCGRAYVNVTNDIKFNIEFPHNIVEFGFGRPKLQVVPLTDPRWSLDRFKYDFDDYSEEGYKYLMSRHKYMDPLYKALGFKFWEGNPAIPFIYHGKIFYYQIRFSGVGHDDPGIRYFMPPISSKPPYIIEHSDRHGNPCTKVIICEGIFDAISLLIQAPDYIPVAVLGSSISDYQIDFIREIKGLSGIVIYMDETEISKRIADKLGSVIDYVPICIYKSGGEDPEEHMKRLMLSNDYSEYNCIKEDYVTTYGRQRNKQISFIYF